MGGALFGWRIHKEPDSIAASMWGEAGDVITVKGFESRLEAMMFIAVYWVFMANSRDDKATALLKEFTSRAKPS